MESVLKCNVCSFESGGYEGDSCPCGEGVLVRYPQVDETFEKDFGTNSQVFKRIYKRTECKKTGKCARCPWHGGMDNSFSRKPKPDKYKNKRNERKFKTKNMGT